MFADDAIGFYLMADDRLSPVLTQAITNYEAAISKLTVLNKKLFTLSTSAMTSLAEEWATLEDLPEKLMGSYEAALYSLRKNLKPLTQRVNVSMVPSARNDLAKMIGQTVSKILGQATLRLSAAVPLKRSPYFATDQALRPAYREAVQPPDMRGRFHGIPKFAKGGIVEGPAGEIDKILAYLTPGEMVLPKDIVEEFRNLKLTSVPKGVKDSTREVLNLQSAMKHLQVAAEAGLDPEAQALYTRGMDHLRESMASLLGQQKLLTQSQQQKLQPLMRDVTALVSDSVSAFDDWRGSMQSGSKQTERVIDSLEDLNETAKDSQSIFGKLLRKVMGPVQFIAIRQAIGDAHNAFRDLLSSGADVAEQTGVGASQIQSFSKNLLTAVPIYNMSRKQAFALADSMVGVSRESLGAANSASDVGDAFARFAASNTPRELAQRLAPLSAAASKLLPDADGEVDALLKRLADQHGFTNDMLASTILNLRSLQGEWTTAGDLAQTATLAAQGGIGAILTDLESPEAKQRVIQSFAIFRTALDKTWTGLGESLSTRISEAATDPKVAQELSVFTGMMQDELRGAIAAGDFESILRNIEGNIQNFSGGSQALTGALKEMFNVEIDISTLEQLRKGTISLTGAAAELKTKIGPSLADPITELGKQATEAQSPWQQLSNTVSSFLTDTIGTRALSILDEFNFQAAASTAWLVKMGIDATGAAVSVGKSLIPRLAAALPSLLGLGAAATTAAGGVGAAGTAAGAAAVSLGAIAAPVLAVVAALAAAVAVFYTLNKWFDLTGKATAFLGGVWGGLKESFGEAFAGLQPIVDGFRELVQWFGLSSEGATTSAETLAMLASAGKFVGQVLGRALTGPIRFIGLMVKYGTWLGETLATVWITMKNFAASIFSASDALTGHSLVPDLEALWEVLTWVGDLLKAVVTPIFDGWRFAIDAAATSVQWVIDKVNSLLSLMPSFREMWDMVKGAGSWVKGAASKVGGAVGGLLAGGDGNLPPSLPPQTRTLTINPVVNPRDVQAAAQLAMPTSEQVQAVLAVEAQRTDVEVRDEVRAVKDVLVNILGALQEDRASAKVMPVGVPARARAATTSNKTRELFQGKN